MLKTGPHPSDPRPDEIEGIRTRARAFFTHAPGSHGWDHTLRVRNLCRTIGRAEGAHPAVLEIAALLHDIGRPEQDRSRGSLCHARVGVELAGPIIAPLSLPADDKRNILHCIATHRFRGEERPATPEARILFDADKLDAIGAVGIARAYLFAGEIGAMLHNPETEIETTRAYSRDDTGYREYRVKLSRIRERMLTPTGRAMAAARHRFMEQFFTRFLAECEGER